MRKTTATFKKVSRAYRLGKINATRYAGVSARAIDYCEYDGTIEWDTEKGDTIFTNCKGEIVSAW